MKNANFVSPVIPATIELKLTTGGNGIVHLGGGWSTPEPHGTWTIGADAFLSVPNLEPGVDYACWLPIGPFLHPPKITSQAIQISVNGVPVHAVTLAGNQILEFTLPASVATICRPAELVLHCSNPASPSDFAVESGDAPDGRVLGLSVWGVRLTPIERPARPIISVRDHTVLLLAPKVAAVTMVFNEPVYLPIWLAHNARQVGIENCYVIDHGSTDGGTANLGACNVIHIPRSPYDPAKQSEWNSNFCSSLLTWFDWVIYSDVDEILMADPNVAATLVEYCRRPLPEVVTAVGLNTLHLVDEEPTIDLSRPVSEQRPYVFACASMCKPLLIKRRVVWSPGSHSSDADLQFDNLYMFHLRWFDHAQGLSRLQKTRAMAWAQDDQGQHQRVQDRQLEEQMRGFGAYPRLNDIDFNPAFGPVRGFMQKIMASTIGRENDTYKVDLDIWHPELWRIPTRFVGTF